MADYSHNSEAAVIAEALIPQFHRHLTGLKIAYLTKEVQAPKQKKNGRPRRVIWGRASKVTPKMVALASQNYKFTIELTSYIWDALSFEEQVALVDHELCHCGNDVDGTYLIPHDIEDFKAIIDRRGFWKRDVVEFAAVVNQVSKRAESQEALVSE